MPFGGLLAGGIGALAGLFGGGKQQQQNQNTNLTTNQSGTQSGTFNNTGSSTGSTSGSYNPNLTPLQQQLIQQFSGGAQDLWNKSQDMSGYTAQGLNQINDTSRASQNNIAANLASRGLAFSPAAGTALTQGELGRTGQQNTFMQGIPLLQRQMQQQSLQQLMSAFQIQPTASTTTGTTNQNTNQTGSQNVNTSGTSNTQGTGSQATYGNPIGGAIAGFGSNAGAAGFFNQFPNLFGGGGGGYGAAGPPPSGTGGQY